MNFKKSFKKLLTNYSPTNCQSIYLSIYLNWLIDWEWIPGEEERKVLGSQSSDHITKISKKKQNKKKKKTKKGKSDEFCQRIPFFPQDYQVDNKSDFFEIHDITY